MPITRASRSNRNQTWGSETKTASHHQQAVQGASLLAYRLANTIVDLTLNLPTADSMRDSCLKSSGDDTCDPDCIAGGTGPGYGLILVDELCQGNKLSITPILRPAQASIALLFSVKVFHRHESEI